MSRAPRDTGRQLSPGTNLRNHSQPSGPPGGATEGSLVSAEEQSPGDGQGREPLPSPLAQQSPEAPFVHLCASSWPPLHPGPARGRLGTGLAPGREQADLHTVRMSGGLCDSIPGHYSQHRCFRPGAELRAGACRGSPLPAGEGVYEESESTRRPAGERFPSCDFSSGGGVTKGRVGAIPLQGGCGEFPPIRATCSPG